MSTFKHSCVNSKLFKCRQEIQDLFLKIFCILPLGASKIQLGKAFPSFHTFWHVRSGNSELNVPILFQEIKEKPDPPKPAARAPPQRAPPVRIKQERFNPEYSTPSPGYGMFRDAIFPTFVGFPNFWQKWNFY